MRLTSLATVLLLASAFLGCDSSSTTSPTDTGIEFGGPSASGSVTTFSFPVQVTIDPALHDARTLQVSINGTPLTTTGGPATFVALVNPGPPLRDDNLLEVSITPVAGGDPLRSSKQFQYLPAKARAHRIARESELIHGPLAYGRVGDYLLDNSEARFIVQDVAKRDFYSVGTFGGNIIDAELVARPGTDNFLEVQPAINVETVINAQTLEVINDGQDGTAAIIRTCGPDDTIDFINPSVLIESAGLRFPASADDTDYDVEGCTDYVLEPNKRAVQMTTTVFNNDTTDRGFYVGDYINGSGELDQFTTLGGGVGEIITNRLSSLSYLGIGEARGVDYSFVLLPEGSTDRSSFFTTSGVSYVLHNQLVINIVAALEPPTFIVPARGSRSFTRFFGVGDGSVANTIDLENEVNGRTTGTLRGCVTASGQPLSDVRVSVARGSGATLRSLATQLVTDDHGCFEGTLTPGDYVVAAARRGYLYEDSETSPRLHPVTISAGTTTSEDFTLPATGRIRVAVTDERQKPVPARISVVGFDPSPEIILPVTTPQGTTATGLFYDPSKDPVPFGLAWLEYAGPDGTVEFEMEPGEYQIVVSRGVEYSTAEERITVTAGATSNVAARIAHVIDTTGFVSSDYHVHGIHSADSRVSDRNRVYQFAGEGVDNVIMTDHEANTDLGPRLRELGFEEFLHATVGEEITTNDYGHFNAYPVRVDDSVPSHGSVDWGVGAEPGRDFTQYGSYSLTPAQIANLATTGPASTGTTTIQINHIDSHFQPLKIDSSLVPPHSFLNADEKLRFRLNPATPELFHHFPALEVWNGASRGKQREFLDLRLGVWFNHLNQGLITTGIGDTDTHEYMSLNVAGARTWTASPSDVPRQIKPSEISAAVNAGRATFGQGPFVETRLIAGDGSGHAADLRLDGETLVRSSHGGIDLDIRVQSPTWAPFDTLEIYANAETVVTQRNGDVPVSFSAEPTLTLRAGEDFDVARVAPFASFPSAERLQTSVVVPFHEITDDTWFVVLAKGSDGTSRPMFPVMVGDLNPASNTTLDGLTDGNLGEGGVMALAVSNALYADVDGVDGFQGPKQP